MKETGKSTSIAQKIFINAIKGYQKTLSPDHSFWAKLQERPQFCKHIPTCSEYAIEAIEKKGVVHGGALASYRILRCNPFSRGGYDPVDKL